MRRNVCSPDRGDLSHLSTPYGMRGPSKKGELIGRDTHRTGDDACMIPLSIEMPQSSDRSFVSFVFIELRAFGYRKNKAATHGIFFPSFVSFFVLDW